MHPIPPELHGRSFTRAEARAVGVSDRMLEGRRFVRIHAGVYRTAQTPATLGLLIEAARRVLPTDAVISHLTHLRWLGLSIGTVEPLHFATTHRHEVVRRGVVVHRYLRPPVVTLRGGVPQTEPRRTFVDTATLLDDRRLLRVGDWLAAGSHVDPDDLCGYVLDSHLDGVRRARRVAPLVRTGVASVRESDLRWAIHRAGLPEPEVNVDLHDDHGDWLARGDLVYRRQKVLVEYDGWQHERDAEQRQWDHLRREQLEAAGWRVIVVTSRDMEDVRAVIARIRQALRARARYAP